MLTLTEELSAKSIYFHLLKALTDMKNYICREHLLKLLKRGFRLLIFRAVMVQVNGDKGSHQPP